MVKDPSGGDQTQEEARKAGARWPRCPGSLDSMEEVGNDQTDHVLTAQLLEFAEELEKERKGSQR